MPRFMNRAGVFGVLLALVALSGCGGEANESDEYQPVEMLDAPPETVDDHGHDHAAHGPHDGELIELGTDGKYHAEMLHDEEAGTLTIYILDGSATKTVPIEAADVTINVKHDGQPEQFKFAASPTEDDPEGLSSRFVSNDAELGEHLHEEGTEPRLVVQIEGSSYSGTLEHSHDHDHEHSHE
ncbi:MAG: hypothetical protein ACREJB_06240 [Planctomycetaceae bacterium]